MRFKVTIDHTKVLADLTDYPLYVDLAGMPANFWSAVANGGGDIRCFAADGVTALPREVVSCDTGTSTGELHVKTNLSATVDTVVFINVDGVGAEPAANSAYGSQNVWTNGYVLVSHDAGLHDSTAAAHNGTDVGTTAAAGKIGAGARSFNGTSNYITLPDSDAFTFADTNGDKPFSVSVWAKAAANAASFPMVAKLDNYTNLAGEWVLCQSNASNYSVQCIAAANSNFIGVKTNNSAVSNEWVYSSMTYDGSEVGGGISIYRNAALLSNTAIYTGSSYDGMKNTASHVVVGGSLVYASNYQSYFNGIIDEVRISALKRAAEWIGTEFANQNAPAQFYGIVYVVTPPVADFSGSPAAGDFPLNVNFTDNSTESPTSWYWDFGDGNSSTLQNPTHTYTQAGTYTVALTATNAGGSNTKTLTGYIQVTTPIPVADFVGNPTFGSFPLNVNFTDNSTDNPTSWLWDFGDGNSSTLQNPTHTYTQAGTYTVALTATNAGGGNTKTLTNYINVTNPPPIADFVATPLNGLAPLLVAFSDTSQYSPTSWHWDFGDGNSSTLQNPTHTYTQTGIYTVVLTVSDGFGQDTETKTDYLTVTGPPPVADFTANLTVGVMPLLLAFTDLSTGNPTSWLWDFGDGNSSTLQNPLHIYAQAGTYTVSLTATNLGGDNVIVKSGYIIVYATAVAIDAHPSTRVNIYKLLIWLLPVRLRQSKTIAWLLALAAPLWKRIYPNLKTWEAKCWYDLKYQTGQVAYLEYVLNANFDPALKRIFIGQGQNVNHYQYLYLDSENQPLYLFADVENQPDYIYTDAELASASAGSYDFSINVPIGLPNEEATLRAVADRYKRDGKQYIIIYF